MITTHTVVQVGYGQAPTIEASLDDFGVLSLVRRQTNEERDLNITVSFHGRPDAVFAELRQLREAAVEALAAVNVAQLLDTLCTGTPYPVNADAPDEGTDYRHDGPCPIHDDPLGTAVGF